MVNGIEQHIYAVVRCYNGVYLFKERLLTFDTDFDTDM